MTQMLDYEDAFKNINIHSMYTCTRQHDNKLSNYKHQRTTTGKYNNRVVIKNIGLHEIGVQFVIDNRLDFSDHPDIPRIWVYVDSTLTIHVEGPVNYESDIYQEFRDHKIMRLVNSPLPEDYKEYVYSLSILLYYMYVYEK